MNHRAHAPKPVALITGASSGIGLALAQCFVAGGHDLVIVADDDRLDAAASELRAMKEKPTVYALTVDLSQRDGVGRVLNEMKERGLEPDVLVCNAGVGVHGEFARETSFDDELRMINLNIVSVVDLTKRVVKSMVERGRGKVLFTASVAGLSPTPLLAVYGATKSFLFSFAEAIRDELRKTNITVTALCPGATDTNFFKRAGMENTKTAKGTLAKPSEVAQAGYGALMRGDDHVVTPFKDRVRTTVGKIMSPAQLAKMARAT